MLPLIAEICRRPPGWAPPKTCEQTCASWQPARQGSTCIKQGVLNQAAVLLQGFEPVALVLAKDVPWFDERFRGPFGARTAHALDMSQHLTFEVNPNEFVMHMPFPRLEATRTAAEAIYDQVGLWQLAMAAGHLHVPSSKAREPLLTPHRVTLTCAAECRLMDPTFKPDLTEVAPCRFWSCMLRFMRKWPATATHLFPGSPARQRDM